MSCHDLRHFPLSVPEVKSQYQLDPTVSPFLGTCIRLGYKYWIRLGTGERLFIFLECPSLENYIRGGHQTLSKTGRNGRHLI